MSGLGAHIREEAREEGREEGKKLTLQQMKRLSKCMIADDLQDMIPEMLSNVAYFKELLVKYNID